MRHIRLILAAIAMIATAAFAKNDGIPFFRNYSSNEYHAHNINFDIACDDHGTVYVANFEGLLYFDGAHWRKVHTPGISRVTCLAKDKNGRVWLGGHNMFGYLYSDEYGCIQIKAIVSDAEANNLSEVDFIKISNNEIYVHTSLGQMFRVENEKKLVPTDSGMEDIFHAGVDSVSRLTLPNLRSISSYYGAGVELKDKFGHAITLNETTGLISNTINYITFDRNHMVWGATNRGIFAFEAVSPYSQITEHQGLKGDVIAISELNDAIYIGTMEGLYIYKGGKLSRLKDADIACWQMIYSDSGKEILAATSDGLFTISANGIRTLTDDNTFSVCRGTDFSYYITGEVDGIYRVGLDGSRKQISKLEKVFKISLEKDVIMAKTIFGELWQMNIDGSDVKCIRRKADVNEPKISYNSPISGYTWQTDGEGRLMEVLQNDKPTPYSPWFYPISQFSANCVFECKDKKVLVGTGGKVIIIDGEQIHDIKNTKPEKPYIREVIAMNDTVLWGGYAKGTLIPLDIVKIKESLPSSCNSVTVYFSTKTSSIICPTQYRYRLNNGEWSRWSEEPVAHFNNLYYGNMTMEVQAMDLFGRISETSSVTWSIDFPIYLRWWALLIYLLIIIGIIAQIMKWRTRRLNHEKEKLESIVKERTAELSDTLDDLKRTQKNLVRMERTATAGKLTQGLIDRILNPINYINNFSRLTSGLAKDLHEDIEDEKDNISEDNYEDCEDILDMMTQNLQKIEEHGTNTTRTLRAMEAMLNNHIGVLIEQNIVPVCRQAVEVSLDYHKDTVAKCNISITAELPETPVMVQIDAEAMHRILLSLITNSVYATAKKYRYAPYSPEIKLTVSEDDNAVRIIIHDNGIGIEDTIKDKVFDPFFTTKPTGEAAGVGLYLVRELVHDQHGTITLTSEKDNFCEFTIEISKS